MTDDSVLKQRRIFRKEAANEMKFCINLQQC